MRIKQLLKWIYKWRSKILLILLWLVVTLILGVLNEQSILNVAKWLAVVWKYTRWYYVAVVGASVAYILKKLFAKPFNDFAKELNKDIPADSSDIPHERSRFSFVDNALNQLLNSCKTTFQLCMISLHLLWKRKPFKFAVIILIIVPLFPIDTVASANTYLCQKVATSFVEKYESITKTEEPSMLDDVSNLNAPDEPIIIYEHPMESSSAPEPTDPAQFITEFTYRSLTNIEKEWLFFRGSQYRVDADEDIKTIANKLLPFLQKILNVKQASTFSESSPQSIQDEIAGASALEEIMKDAGDLDAVIRMRTAVWDKQYRSFAIAWLLANNMQKYAVVVAHASKGFETIEYYYAYSIFWSWRALSFNTLDLPADVILAYISGRYKDIAYYAPSGSDTQKSAQALCDALSMILRETDLDSIMNGTAIIW